MAGLKITEVRTLLLEENLKKTRSAASRERTCVTSESNVNNTGKALLIGALAGLGALAILGKDTAPPKPEAKPELEPEAKLKEPVVRYLDEQIFGTNNEVFHHFRIEITYPKTSLQYIFARRITKTIIDIPSIYYGSNKEDAALALEYWLRGHKDSIDTKKTAKLLLEELWKTEPVTQEITFLPHPDWIVWGQNGENHLFFRKQNSEVEIPGLYKGKIDHPELIKILARNHILGWYPTIPIKYAEQVAETIVKLIAESGEPEPEVPLRDSNTITKINDVLITTIKTAFKEILYSFEYNGQKIPELGFDCGISVLSTTRHVNEWSLTEIRRYLKYFNSLRFEPEIINKVAEALFEFFLKEDRIKAYKRRGDSSGVDITIDGVHKSGYGFPSYIINEIAPSKNTVSEMTFEEIREYVNKNSPLHKSEDLYKMAVAIWKAVN